MDRLLDFITDCVNMKKRAKKWTRCKIPSAKPDMTLAKPLLHDDYRPNDKYTRLRLLQEGEGDECELSRSKSTGKLIVIKHVDYKPPPKGPQTGRRKPLTIEARMLLTKLGPHPNIIRLFATQHDPSKYRRHLLFMEFCRGGDLLDQLRKFQRLKMPAPQMFTLHVFVGLAHALAYIHHGLRLVSGGDDWVYETDGAIIHGDIKPDNILLRWPGQQECGMPDVVLADFGMSQVETESRGVSGTVGYDSPEVLAITILRNRDPDAFRQAANARIMTTKSDMYQLGLIMHLMATDKSWKIGADPSTLKLPEQYVREQMVGFMPATIWCLQPEPQDRPECSWDLEEGMLHAVECLKKQRDALFERDGALDKGLWNISES